MRFLRLMTIPRYPRAVSDRVDGRPESSLPRPDRRSRGGQAVFRLTPQEGFAQPRLQSVNPKGIRSKAGRAKSGPALAVVLELAALAACSAPSTSVTSEQATAAALTVQAVMTQLAPSETPVPPTPLPSPTQTLTPPPLPTATLTLTSTPPPTLGCAGVDDSDFVADVTVPDGTTFAANTQFTKTWRIQNSGECTWVAGYLFVHIEGPLMGAPESVPVPIGVAPGQSMDLSVNFTAPSAGGTYISTWQMQAPDGTLFGSKPYVQIVVP